MVDRYLVLATPTNCMTVHTKYKPVEIYAEYTNTTAIPEKETAAMIPALVPHPGAAPTPIARPDPNELDIDIPEIPQSTFQIRWSYNR
jgi:hypothetical protein